MLPLHSLSLYTTPSLIFFAIQAMNQLHASLLPQAHQAQEEGLGDSSVLLLQTYLGLGWVLGCCAFGFVVLQKNTECRVGRQYLCQASMFLCGVSTLAFTAVEGNNMITVPSIFKLLITFSLFCFSLLQLSLPLVFSVSNIVILFFYNRFACPFYNYNM